MEKVISYITKEAVVFHTIASFPPKSGSYADYILLKQEYRKLDPSSVFGDNPKAVEKLKQLLFNTEFLEEMKAAYGTLHCVYCGEQDLQIYYWWEHKRRDNQATADHFIPKSKDPELAFDKSNLRVCCLKCNNKKHSHLWKEKFPYKTSKDENINKRG